MKKIFGLLTALLVAVATMAFTSCATDNTNAKFGESPLTAIQGDFGTIDPTSSSGGKVVFSVAYANTFTAWGGGDGTLNFKGHSNAGKNDYKYGGNDIVLVSAVDGISKVSDGNMKLTGLVNGTTYTFTFDTIPTLSLTITK